MDALTVVVSALAIACMGMVLVGGAILFELGRNRAALQRLAIELERVKNSQDEA